jgi:hypothetical protein
MLLALTLLLLLPVYGMRATDCWLAAAAAAAAAAVDVITYGCVPAGAPKGNPTGHE